MAEYLEWRILKYDLTKRCSVEGGSYMMCNAGNPLFSRDFLIWGDVRGLDQRGNKA